MCQPPGPLPSPRLGIARTAPWIPPQAHAPQGVAHSMREALRMLADAAAAAAAALAVGSEGQHVATHIDHGDGISLDKGPAGADGLARVALAGLGGMRVRVKPLARDHGFLWKEEVGNELSNVMKNVHRQAEDGRADEKYT